MDLLQTLNEIVNPIELSNLPVEVKFYRENSNSEQNFSIDCRFCEEVPYLSS